MDRKRLGRHRAEHRGVLGVERRRCIGGGGDQAGPLPLQPHGAVLDRTDAVAHGENAVGELAAPVGGVAESGGEQPGAVRELRQPGRQLGAAVAGRAGAGSERGAQPFVAARRASDASAVFTGVGTPCSRPIRTISPFR